MGNIEEISHIPKEVVTLSREGPMCVCVVTFTFDQEDEEEPCASSPESS